MTLYLLKIVRLELLTHKASPPPPLPLGCSEALMVGAVTSEAVSVAGKESLSMDAYARALMMIPPPSPITQDTILPRYWPVLLQFLQSALVPGLV